MIIRTAKEPATLHRIVLDNVKIQYSCRQKPIERLSITTAPAHGSKRRVLQVLQKASPDIIEKALDTYRF